VVKSSFLKNPELMKRHVRLNTSFAAVYTALNVPRIGRRAILLLLVIHSILIIYSAHVHSPTLNEPAHLVAGLSYWKFGRFEVYRVNPPLVRMVAALPVMAAGYEEDWSDFFESPGARPEMEMGEAFVRVNGERSSFLFMIARLACIPFSWLGAVICYLWARDLYSRPAGVLACAIWCFEPNILAHAALITPDVPATALGVAACYTFWRWLRQPTWAQAALTGIVLGLAELAKTTLILLYPLWPVMWLIYRWPNRNDMVVRDWLREAGMLTLRLAVGINVLNLGYGFEGSFTRLKDFYFVSDLFSGQQRIEGGSFVAQPHSNSGARPSVFIPKSTNRFANSWIGELLVPLPKNYLLGIDIQQSDFESYGQPSYLLGTWQIHGWWYYYLYACAIKVPLGLLLLGFFALFSRSKAQVSFVRLKEILQRLNSVLPLQAEAGQGLISAIDIPRRVDNRTTAASRRDELVLLLPAIVVFVVVSSKTGFNEHMRYVLPSFPYFFIATSNLAQVFSPCREELSDNSLTKVAPVVYKYRLKKIAICFSSAWIRRMPVISTVAVAFLGSWFIASGLWIYPHSLSYFNESIGGPLHGAEQLLGSNLDWGQDLCYLKKWIRGQGESANELYLAYFGSVVPADVGLQSTKPWTDIADLSSASTSAMNPNGSISRIEGRARMAISVNFVHGFSFGVRDGIARISHSLPKAIRYWTARRIINARIGYSIVILEL
jgi:4-amino-4-deoxy-L-arabinose transferase-like glycosyltransferase